MSEPNRTMAENGDELLTKLLDQFRESFDMSWSERQRAEQCRDYYDGFQWTEDEIDTLKRRKQPIVTSNRIRPKINALIGFEKRQRTDPKAFPRTPKHDNDAEAATDAIRFVCDRNKFNTVRSDVAECVFIEGYAAAKVSVRESKRGDFDIRIAGIMWDRFYRDPHSRKRDFSDADYLGEVVWLDESDALRMFPGREEAVRGAYSYTETASETYDDRPKLVWSDVKRKRIRILQPRWRENGVWHVATICAGGFLKDAQPSPYLDENDDPECDIIAVSAYVTRENERYGEVFNMLSVQDEINKRRSKALHRLSVRQVIAEHGAVEDAALARRELAKPDGFVEVNSNLRFEIVDGMANMQGEMQLLQEAKAEIDASGVNPALEGDVQAPSGRAVEALQAAGLQEMAVVFDSLREFSLSVYRQVWNRVRQYWTAEKWIRVTDDEDNMRWVPINKPVTAAEQVQMLVQQGQPVPPALAMQVEMNPGQVVGVQAPVGELDVDIIVEDGPDTVTIQSEQFNALVEMAKANPQAVPFEMIVRASNLRNKDEILERLESGGGLPPEVAKQLQALQKALSDCQKQLQQAQGQLQDRQVEWAKVEIDREKARIDAYKAETDRLQAVRPDVGVTAVVEPQAQQ